LRGKEYNCILIGAGVRKDNDNMLLFEKLINAIHKSALSANICFNSNPYGTADAVKRWV
jgi:copper homeostasis protein CutC